jgi:hypothetical protein
MQKDKNRKLCMERRRISRKANGKERKKRSKYYKEQE